MHVLLDECLPRRLARELTGHVVATVPDVGWSGFSNGKLLALIEDHYDAFVTIDQNLTAQQKIAGQHFGVVVLRAPSNQLTALQALVPGIFWQRW